MYHLGCKVNFSMILKGNYEILYITIPMIILAYIYANRFTIAGMGEDFATNLGLNYKKVVNLGLVIVALVTVCVVVTAGSIPFIGLIVPNIVSIYKGDNIKDSIWHTGLFGAIFVLTCDIFGRLVIYPYEIPIGLTVGVIGSIIFLYLILRRNVKCKLNSINKNVNKNIINRIDMNINKNLYIMGVLVLYFNNVFIYGIDMKHLDLRYYLKEYLKF